ncbi:hypothetical protein GCM10010358_25190 [Streptomyces minutiscleroticus]|uniref:Uncharacterized protein n=1 Tax=Streptomyces minutiscleroticus TaxID=68238 RepID=A0A918KPN0_9ACTN|nr:hypothetical protein GCM10010358_25190 [Streptomyces minutiscleroticus]
MAGHGQDAFPVAALHCALQGTLQGTLLSPFPTFGHMCRSTGVFGVVCGADIPLAGSCCPYVVVGWGTDRAGRSGARGIGRPGVSLRIGDAAARRGRPPADVRVREHWNPARRRVGM